MDKLDEKRLKFCREFTIDRCKAKAAARAGFSKKSAKTMGSRIFKEPAVQAEIARLDAITCSATMLTVERVVQGFCEIAFNDQEKSADRKKALENLAKYMGMFNHKQEIEISDGRKNQEYKAMFDSMTVDQKIKWLKAREEMEDKKLLNNTDTDLIEGELINEPED